MYLPQTHTSEGTGPITSLTYSERVKVEILLRLGWTQIRIAQELQRSPSTISYELARCSPYNANAEKTDAAGCRYHCGRKIILTAVLKNFIFESS